MEIQIAHQCYKDKTQGFGVELEVLRQDRDRDREAETGQGQEKSILLVGECLCLPTSHQGMAGKVKKIFWCCDYSVCPCPLHQGRQGRVW